MRRRRLAAADAGGAGAAGAAWDELLAESADRGAPEVASDTVRMAADRMTRAHGLDARVRRALDTVVGIVEESWYGGVDPAPGALSRPLRTVSDALRAVPVPLHRRLFPASVIGRRRRRREDAGHGRSGQDDRGSDTSRWLGWRPDHRGVGGSEGAGAPVGEEGVTPARSAGGTALPSAR